MQATVEHSNVQLQKLACDHTSFLQLVTIRSCLETKKTCPYYWRIHQQFTVDFRNLITKMPKEILLTDSSTPAQAVFAPCCFWECLQVSTSWALLLLHHLIIKGARRIKSKRPAILPFTTTNAMHVILPQRNARISSKCHGEWQNDICSISLPSNIILV